MGYALAKAARRRGAKVTLISGPSSLPPPSGIILQKVQTAQEMYEETFRHYEQATIIIKAAAVSDYRPEQCSSEKIKKGALQEHLSLIANRDILKELGAHRGNGIAHRPLLVGFAAESRGHLKEGQRKLLEKNLDMIVINDIKSDKTGFESDTNKVTIIDKTGRKVQLPILSKDDTAMRILDELISLAQTVGAA
jgi:phosphopantothenoylcysteine decarboxylase/phosphopantothenate--cysteine ligase